MIINTCTRYVMYEHIRVVKVKISIIKKRKEIEISWISEEYLGKRVLSDWLY